MITIKVTGPGGTIDFEMMVIKMLFEQIGISVIVENEYPWPDDNPLIADAFIEDRIKSIKNGTFQSPEIKLIAEHCPWGG